jgi:FYVE, RhoGEF and PH domain containing 5/6
MTSLETPQPILSRAELTSIFSNFIDIWNFNHTFYSALSQHLTPMSPSSSTMPLPALSPLLLSHFPYLSLYTPFVTAFGDSMTSLGSLRNSNPGFAAFMEKREADPRCGRLGLRDWLLRIVQRCPRYLLLLKVSLFRRFDSFISLLLCRSSFQTRKPSILNMPH